MKSIQTKELIRKPSFLILCISALILPVAYELYCHFWHTTGFETLYELSGYWFYVCAVMVVATCFCLSGSQIEEVDEAISGCTRPGYYPWFGFTCFFGVFVLSQVVIFLVLELLAALHDPTNDAFVVLPKMFLCNLSLPMIICILAGYLDARWPNQHHSAIALIGFLLMTSPLSELMVNGDRPGTPSDRFIHAVRHAFSIFYENSNWVSNPQVGLQTEWSRFAVQFFWILLFLGILCLLNKRKVCASACLFLVCGVICLVYSNLPASTFRHDNSLNLDAFLYKEQAEGMPDTAETNYSITSYDLALHFGRQLNVTGTVEIQASEPTNQFVLTLYRGYPIESITGAEGTEPVTWSVQDDFVTIQTEQPVKQLRLKLQYSGYHNLFYSNMDGAMLPGWFPWYPMAGGKQIGTKSRYLGWDYDTYNRMKPANIRLTIEAPFRCISNVTQRGEQVYEGSGDSITVIGGYVKQTEDSVVADVLPLALTVPESQAIAETKASYQHVQEVFKSYGLDEGLIANRRIIQTSADLSCTANCGTAVFSDYILTNASELDLREIMSQLILQKHRGSELADLICFLGIDETPEKTLELWQFFLSDMPTEELSDLEVQLRVLVDSAGAAGKGSTMVQELVTFLFSEYNETEEAIFWKELNERYGEA